MSRLVPRSLVVGLILGFCGAGCYILVMGMLTARKAMPIEEQMRDEWFTVLAMIVICVSAIAMLVSILIAIIARIRHPYIYPVRWRAALILFISLPVFVCGCVIPVVLAVLGFVGE